MDSKQLYEELGAVAEQLPAEWRPNFAEVVRELIKRPLGHSDAARRWLRDAGYNPVRNYEIGS